MTATINISDLIKSHPLQGNEYYNLYLCRNDEWRNTFGFIDGYTDAERVATHVCLAINNPDILGVWVTLESHDGTKDITIFKTMKRI